MYLIRVFFLCVLLVFSSLAIANDEVLSEMYELSNLSIPEQSLEKHLTKVNELLLRAPNDAHVAALANILKASYYLLNEDFTQANQFLIKAKPAVDQIQSDKLTNEYQLAQIFVLRSNSEINEAIEIGEKLYPKVIESWPKNKLSHLVLEIAYLNSFNYQYDKALDNLRISLDYSFESDDPFQIAETYNLFGVIYSEINDEISANRYYQKAVEVIEKNPSLTINTYLYSNLGDSHRLLKEFDKAITYLDKSERMAKADEDTAGISFSYQMRSRLLVDQEKYSEALGYLLKAKDMSEQIGEKLFNYEMHSELAYVYYKLDDLDKADEHLTIAEVNAGKQAETDKFFIETIRARIFYEKGLYQEAYDSLDESYDNYRKQFNDDLTRVSNLSREQLDQAQLNFDNKLLARENELNAQNVAESRRFNIMLWASIILLLITLLIFIWFIYRFRKLAIKNRNLALTDNLTRLPNRRHIFRKVSEHHGKSEKGNGGYSVIIFDIDHFKAINDRYGHHIGDKVIQATKDICQAILRESDTIGRIGGEEFLILLPNTQVKDAEQIAERIREQFEVYDFATLALGLKVTSSFGVTAYTPEDEKLDAVINRADKLMYKVKHQGRNKVFANSVSKAQS